VGGAVGGFVGDAIDQHVGLTYGTKAEREHGWDWNRSFTATVMGGVTGAAGARAAWMMRACFAAGTPIRTPDGWKSIEYLRPGDMVLSRDESDPAGEVSPKVVEETFQRLGRVWLLRLEGGVTIRTTPEHPFFPLRTMAWTPAAELRAGDVLRGETGDARVEAIEDTGEYTSVYNCRVADWHTYFVGCAEWGFSVWAHNTYDGLRAGLSDAELNRFGTAYVENLQARVAGGKTKASWKQIEAATGRSFNKVERMALRQYAEHAEGLGPVMEARGLKIQVSNPDGPVGKPSTVELNTLWAKGFADLGADVPVGPRPYGRGERWITDTEGTRIGRLDVSARLPAEAGLADPLIHVNTVTMMKLQGRLVPHPTQEVPSALRIRAFLGDEGAMILIPKTANGSFYLVPKGGGSPVAIPEFATPAGLVNHLKRGG
jgi:hypothetical protein